MQPAGRSHSWGFRVPSKTTFLEDVTAGYSCSLPIFSTVTFIAEKNTPVLFCMGWTLKADDYVMLRKIRKNILVRLPRICPRHFLSLECFNHYSLEKSKACETLCSPSTCEAACFAPAAKV